MVLANNWKVIFGAVALAFMHSGVVIECCSGGGGGETDAGAGHGEPLDFEDFVKGDALVEEDDGIDHIKEAIEHGDGFQGDMLLDDEQLEAMKQNTSDVSNSAWISRKWTKSGSTVNIAYVISSSFTSRQRQMIAKGIQDYTDRTCIRFVRRTSQRNYINIQKREADRCQSAIGMGRGSQNLFLGDNCFTHATIVHEFMHAIGYYHEQSRSDRDSHVTIHWENIIPRLRYNFQKCNHCNNQGLQYDLQSVMHYPDWAFSTGGGKKTITCKTANPCKIGNRQGFSANDLQGINKLYSCSGGGGGSCTDRFENCKYWKNHYCKGTYENWMNQHCKKSCGKC